MNASAPRRLTFLDLTVLQQQQQDEPDTTPAETAPLQAPLPEEPPRTRQRNYCPQNFRTMNDDELIDAIDFLDRESTVIKIQLDDDLVDGGSIRGNSWRNSAGVARAHRVADLKLATAEMARRKAPPSKADRQAAHLAQLEVQRQLALEKQRAAEAEIEMRQAQRARMFLVTATDCLTSEQMESVWERARGRFPCMVGWLQAATAGFEDELDNALAK